MGYYKNRMVVLESDVASLDALLKYGGNEESFKIDFGGDGAYKIYIVTDNECEIPSHYKLKHHLIKRNNKDGSAYLLSLTLKDHTDKLTFKAVMIDIYRAGEMGCLIHLIEPWN